MTNIVSQIFGKGIKPCILISILTNKICFETTGSLMVISNLQGRGEHTSKQCCVRKHGEREAGKDDHVAFPMPYVTRVPI